MTRETDRSVLIRITPTLFEQIATRDNEGNRLRVTLGEPTEYIYEDVSGDVLPVYTPTITVDYSDNPFHEWVKP